VFRPTKIKHNISRELKIFMFNKFIFSKKKLFEQFFLIVSLSQSRIFSFDIQRRRLNLEKSRRKKFGKINCP